jgi:hypothetical protein
MTHAPVLRENDEAPDNPLSVYWELEADVPRKSIVDDDPGRLPVAHLGISFDGRGYLVLLFNGLWGERNDFWEDTLEEAFELAETHYGVTRDSWWQTGASWDARLDRRQ